MTKRMTLAAAAMLVAMVTACGEEENPAPSRDRGDAGTATSGLSAAYGRSCARCHGAEGRGDVNPAYPPLPGNRDEASYIAIVRAGSTTNNEMTAYLTSTISDADLKADYAWMKNERK